MSHHLDVTLPRSTPLSRRLAATPEKKVTPLDAFRLARNHWLAGERLDIGKIAAELGVGRATVFRWVGSRENLYAEICSQLFKKTLEQADAQAPGTGAEKLIDILAHLLRRLARAPQAHARVHLPRRAHFRAARSPCRPPTAHTSHASSRPGDARRRSALRQRAPPRTRSRCAARGCCRASCSREAAPALRS